MVFTGIRCLTMKTPAIKTKKPCSFNFLYDLIFLVRQRLSYSGQCVFVFVLMGLVLPTKKTLVVKAGAFNFHC